MDASEIQRLVHSQIGRAGDATNLHGVDLRNALVPPQLTRVIERTVRAGKTHDSVIEVWLLLIEDPESGKGYRIVAEKDGSSFGLASEGFPSDQHLVLSGWYGDFMTAFEAM